MPQSSATFSASNISWIFKLPLFISAYFEGFQPILPVIHQPTFDAASTPEPLLQAVACIGAVYHFSGGHRDISLALIQSGIQSLDSYVETHGCAGFREVWVLQAYVLFEYFAFHSCDDTLFEMALGIHRRLVDALRKYQLLQDSQPSDGLAVIPDLESLLSGAYVERDWRSAVTIEARKRCVYPSSFKKCANKHSVIYSLYYLDVQMSICCNIRPLLTALEIKYDLPCSENIWSAPTASAWQSFVLDQDCSLNEAEDDAANRNPRPVQGDLYSTLMHLMSPAPPGKRLGLLWRSAFAGLVLVMQIQMMVRDLILGSTFLYHNIRSPDDKERHRLSIVPESARAQVMEALNTLADLMPTVQQVRETTEANHGPHELDGGATADVGLWNQVWIAWHYTVLCLTHQDGLLTNGVVEYGLPTAISTSWELGKPRSKHLRDVYEDRDVIRVAASLENIQALLMDSVGAMNQGTDCAPEDPFITILGFKSCLMGWRTVRLLALGLQERSGSHSNVYKISARVLMQNILTSIGLKDEKVSRHADGQQGVTAGSATGFSVLNGYEAQYLSCVEAAVTKRNMWPVATWIEAVFAEAGASTS